MLVKLLENRSSLNWHTLSIIQILAINWLQSPPSELNWRGHAPTHSFINSGSATVNLFLWYTHEIDVVYAQIPCKLQEGVVDSQHTRRCCFIDSDRALCIIIGSTSSPVVDQLQTKYFFCRFICPRGASKKQATWDHVVNCQSCNWHTHTSYHCRYIYWLTDDGGGGSWWATKRDHRIE